MENNEYLKSLDEEIKASPSQLQFIGSDKKQYIAVPVDDYTRYVNYGIILSLLARAKDELYRSEITDFLLKYAASPNNEVKNDA